MTYEEIVRIREDQEADFRERFGFDWPNCSVVECDYKACLSLGSDKCYAHTNGLSIPSLEDYYK